MPGALCFAALLCSVFVPFEVFAQTSVLTQHNDNSRTGQNLNETLLNTADVTVGQFGKLFSLPVDGQVYAQPLYVPNVTINGGTHNVLVVATENDSIYAFDADSNLGANAVPLWQVSLVDNAHGVPIGVTETAVSEASGLGCTDLQPQIGVTSTPVIDPTTNTIYVEAESTDGTNFYHRLHALDLFTGDEQSSGPVIVTATVSGTGDGSDGNGNLTFNPLYQLNRDGLLLQNGTVFLAFGSLCDDAPFHGWLFAYDAASLNQTSVYVTTPNGGLGGFWMAGSGISADSSGNIYIASGNGDFDSVNIPATETGDTLLKLGTANQTLTLLDYFTPQDQQTLDENDSDLGSGGVLLLPEQPGSYPDILIQAGKEGRMYVVDRDQMTSDNSHYCSGCSSDPEILEESASGAIGGVWGMPAYWNNNIYFWGAGDVLTSIPLTNGLPDFTNESTSSVSFAWPGATPSISTNGSTAGTAILWAVDSSQYGAPGRDGSPGSTLGPAVLHAFDATNVSNELWNSTQASNNVDQAGNAVKFATPTISNGKVYLGTSTEVDVYGLFNGVIPPSITTEPSNQTVTAGQMATFSVVAAGSSLTYQWQENETNIPNANSATYTTPATALTDNNSTFDVIVSNSLSAVTSSVASLTVSPTTAPTITTQPVSQTVTVGQTATFLVVASGSTPLAYQWQENGSNIPNATSSSYTTPPTATTDNNSTFDVIVSNAFGSVPSNTVALMVNDSDPDPVSTGVISVDFVGTGTPMGSTEIAGVVPEADWNDAEGAKSSSPLALSDSNGNSTATTITWTADDGWQEGIADTPGNNRMMNGYLDNGDQDTTLITVSNLPSNPNGYAVYVYAEGAGDGTNTNTGIYQISGTGITTTSVSLTYNSPFNGTFTQANNSMGNYVMFTIPNVSGFTLEGIPSTASNGYERAPLNGIQIVPLGPPSPDFSISASPGTQSVAPGGSTSYMVTVGALNGFTDSVNLTVSGLPAGATYSFNPASISTSGTSTLMITTDSSTPDGTSTLAITGTDASGAPAHSTNVTLNVASSTSSATAISIDFVGLDTTPMGSSEVAGVVALSNWNDAAGASSPSPLALMDQNGNPTTANVSWTADDVWDASAVEDVTGNYRMMRGYLDDDTEDTTTVTVSGLPPNAYGYDVYVYAQDLTTAIKTAIYQISGAGITTTSAILQFQSSFNGTFNQATSNNPLGNYVLLTIPNVSGFTLSATPNTSTIPAKRAVINGLQIVPLGPPTPDFTISASPETGAVAPGGDASYTVTLSALNGFSDSVNLAVSGLPTGATYTFTPESISASGTSTLMVTTGSSTPIGTSTLTITGTDANGSPTHSTTVSLIVSAGSFSNPISIDFVGGDVPMANTETAGVVAASNWNDAAGASNPSGLALLDSTGAATGATVTWLADDVWQESITDAPGNVRMMKGYLDNGNQGTTIVTVGGLPPNAAGYSVYVYAQGQSNGTTTNTGIYQISGVGITTTSVSLTYNAEFNGTFTQANNSVGNYVVFTIPDVAGFTLQAIPSTASNGYERAPVNGIQIVPLGSPNPDFTISASPATANVADGGNTSYTVTISAENGFSDAVNLTASGLPSGATYSFNPSSITGAGSATLKVTAGASTPNGSSTLTITGTDANGSPVHSATVTLTVATPDFTISASPGTQSVADGANTPYTVTVDAVNGFTDSVNLSVSGLPAGATYSFNPASIAGSGNSTLTITAAANTPAGNSTLTITGTDANGSPAHSTTVTLTVLTADFTISASPGTQTVADGNSTPYAVTIGALNGFSDVVNLAVSGLPAGATYSFNPSSITGAGSATLKVTAGASTPNGSSTLTITGTDANGSPVHSATVTLTVATPDFTISANPGTQTVSDGNSMPYTVTIGALNGFSGSVNLTVSGLPTGATYSFNPASISGSGGSTLTVTAGATTPTGNSTLTITGTVGALAHSTTVTFDVVSASSFSNPISIDFVGGDVSMAASEVAGVVPESNWNDATGANNSSGMALLDSTGAATGATVTWSADDVWEESITDSPGNVRMMKGYLDNGYQDTTVITVANLPSNIYGYSVYVYAEGSGNGTATNTGIYQISGSGITASSVSLTYNSNFNGTFTQANDSAGNYVVFTIPNVSGFTLSAIPSTASNGYERAPVNGMQIVPLGPPNPDFTIAASPGTATVAPGNNTTYTVTVSALSGFSDSVDLSVTGLPTGATYSFNPSSISAAGSSVLTITAGTSTPDGSSVLTITGTDPSSSLTHTTNVTLTVATPDFTISISPATQNVVPGDSAPYTVTIGALSGFSDSVTLSASGLPSGGSYSFNPTSISGSGTSTLTVNTTPSTPTGSSTLTITGTDVSTSSTHSTTVTLTVQTSAFGGDTISIDFVGEDVPMGSTEVAGVVPKSNWNDATGASNSLPLALVDATGTATTAAVTWSADDVWEESITDAPGNVRMMKGYLDNGYEHTTTVNVTGLPSDPNGYTVYVYADGSPSSGGNTGLYQISGPGITTTTISLTYNSNFNSTFTQANSSIGNYVVFTIPSVTGFTLSAIPSTAPSGYERAPVNGIQIVGN